jgi:hypothetical protein
MVAPRHVPVLRLAFPIAAQRLLRALASALHWPLPVAAAAGAADDAGAGAQRSSSLLPRRLRRPAPARRLTERVERAVEADATKKLERIAATTARSRTRAWLVRHRTGLDPSSLLWLWWCAALLAHYDDRMHWGLAPVITLSVVASVLGMLVARSPLAMLAVAGFQLSALWSLMPRVDNHWMFAGFIDLALIGATATWMIRKRRRGAPTDQFDVDWYQLAAPVLRLLVLVMYGFAVFHKLNTGFLDPHDSCAVHLHQRMTQSPLVPFAGTPAGEAERHAIIVAVLSVEAAIPLLLAGRRTWFAGIAVGVAFHLSTGVFMRHYPSIMMALYWVFVPISVQQRCVAVLDSWVRRATRGRLAYVAVIVGPALALSVATLIAHELMARSGLTKHAAGHPYWWVLRGWNCFVVIGAAAACIAFVRVRGAVRHAGRRFSSSARWLHAIVLIFTINCLSPYLGLKTVTSINMWSNLVVTGTDDGNHLLLRASSIRLFDYTSDVVSVVRSNDAQLARLSRRGQLVPWVMFRREVHRAVLRARAEDRPVAVSYVRRGERVNVPDAERDPLLADRGSYLERKRVSLTSAPSSRPTRCSP